MIVVLGLCVALLCVDIPSKHSSRERQWVGTNPQNFPWLKNDSSTTGCVVALPCCVVPSKQAASGQEGRRVRTNLSSTLSLIGTRYLAVLLLACLLACYLRDNNGLQWHDSEGCCSLLRAWWRLAKTRWWRVHFRVGGGGGAIEIWDSGLKIEMRLWNFCLFVFLWFFLFVLRVWKVCKYLLFWCAKKRIWGDPVSPIPPRLIFMPKMPLLLPLVWLSDVPPSPSYWCLCWLRKEWNCGLHGRGRGRGGGQRRDINMRIWNNNALIWNCPSGKLTQFSFFFLSPYFFGGRLKVTGRGWSLVHLHFDGGADFTYTDTELTLSVPALHWRGGPV